MSFLEYQREPVHIKSDINNPLGYLGSHFNTTEKALWGHEGARHHLSRNHGNKYINALFAFQCNSLVMRVLVTEKPNINFQGLTANPTAYNVSLYMPHTCAMKL